MLLFHAAHSAEAYEEFGSLRDAGWNLLVLLTTANFPDVMIPVYKEHRVYCLFFIAFLVVGLFFLMNLLLAVAYNSYATQLQYNVARFTYKRKQSLQIAFKLLDISGDGYIELPEMEAALDELDRPAVSIMGFKGFSWMIDEDEEIMFGEGESQKMSMRTAIARALLAELMAQLVTVQVSGFPSVAIDSDPYNYRFYTWNPTTRRTSIEGSTSTRLTTFLA
jgi:hypothetical protein